MFDIFINWIITFFADIITPQGIIGFFAGYAFHYWQGQKELKHTLCHSCKKGHYVYDPKHVRDNPVWFRENKRNGYYCDKCGRSAPYDWKP